MYKQSIIFFGIVIPLLIAAVVIGACYYVHGKFTASIQHKERHFSGFERNRFAALEIEAQLKRQRGDFERWNEFTGQETFSLVTSHLRSIGETLPPKEFQQTAFERLANSGGFGGVSAQRSSGLKFNFRGTYRSVQRAFLELETRMPNLQLQELKIEPIQTPESSLLNVQVTFTAWEK